MEPIVIWAVTGLAAKMLADPLRRMYGFATPGRFASATRSIETDLAYALAWVVALTATMQIGPHAGLIVGIVLRAGAIAADRVLLPGNHAYLELLVAIVCLRLLDQPAALACVLQVMVASVWIYSVYQKLYQREFADGSFFYITTQEARWALGTWTGQLQRVPAIGGDFGPVDPTADTFCRRLARLVLLTEAGAPPVAIALSGTFWSPFVLLAVGLPVGLLTSETNFMITNVLLAAMFLIPFSTAGLLAGAADPVVAAIVGWCLLWPPMHAFLARRLIFSPWKLAGWGMYSRHEPRIDIVLPDGALQRVTGSAIHTRLLREFGICRIGWLRARIWQAFFRWSHPRPARGLVFRWYRRRGSHFVTTALVTGLAPGSEPVRVEIADAQGVAAFHACVSSLPHAVSGAPATVSRTPASHVDATRASV